MKNLCKMILILSMVLINVQCLNPASSNEKRPQVIVDQDITEDTVWKSGKDYIVLGNVVVEENATLTIEKDVNVYFDEDEEAKGKLYVQGIINANSNDSTRMIVFQSLIHGQNVELQRGLSLYNDYKYSTFDHCVFSYLLYGMQGADTRATVKNCRFDNCYHAIDISKCDSLFISNCKFKDNSCDIKIELSKGLVNSSISIIGNEFIECDKIAIEINDQSQSRITDNMFQLCNIAVNCSYNSNVNINHNEFEDCKTGISLTQYGMGEITNNNFIGGWTFVRVSVASYPIINNNNFLECNGDKIYADVWTSSQYINCTSNWWGNINKEEIEISIYDYHDAGNNSTNGIVSYEPFLFNYCEDCGIRVLKIFLR